MDFAGIPPKMETAILRQQPAKCTPTTTCIRPSAATPRARRWTTLGPPKVVASPRSASPITTPCRKTSTTGAWRSTNFPATSKSSKKRAKLFAPDLSIRLGLECDWIEGHETWIEELATRAPFDYLIGSVHYLEPGWAVDDPDPKWQGKWQDPDAIDEIWTKYWSLYVECISSGLFDILAHPDLVKKFGHRPSGDLRRFYEPSIEAARNVGVAIELSTAGLRKPCAEMYPARDFLELARQADIPLVIGSDAHLPEDVGADFDTAVALARDVDYTQTARFENRQRTLVAL